MEEIVIINYRLYLLLFFALLLFIAFRLLSWLLPAILKREEKRKMVHRYKTLTELVIWIIYFIWAVQYLHYTNKAYALALLVLLFLFTLYTLWIGLKDLIAGAFMKAAHRLSISEIIKVGEFSGKITRFGHANIVLETDDGKIIYLPYSYIFGKALIKSQPAEAIHRHTFRLIMPLSRSIRHDIEKLRIFILNIPWISLKKEPQIRTIEETGQGFEIEITIFSIGKEHFLEIEKLVRAKFEIPDIDEHQQNNETKYIQ